MKLIVGLGNYGNEYKSTRHNVGFMVIDEIAKKYGFSRTFSNFKGEYYKEKMNGEEVIFLKPQTYMNLSGESVSALMRYFKIPLENLVVIYDDLALPVGQVRLRESGSAGGHNGMKNIIQHLGSDKFKRIRIGIDKHEFIPVVDYVLGKFSKEDQDKIDVAVKSVADACFDITKMDFNRVMGKYNKKG